MRNEKMERLRRSKLAIIELTARKPFRIYDFLLKRLTKGYGGSNRHIIEDVLDYSVRV